MDWLHPTYAWTLLAVPIVVWLYWRAARWRRAAQEQFGDATIVQRLATALRPYRRRVKAGLVVAAVALLGVSLAGPRFGTQLRTVERKGVDLVVALDVSASMRAQDVPPDRLRRAKNEIRDLLDQLTGDRVGLVLFAGDGLVQCPLTTDYEAFRLFLDVAEPDQVPSPGTNLGAAVEAAARAFDAARPASDSAARGQPRPRALLVVSDGENHVGDLEAVQERAEEGGMALFTAGVGTEDGARVPTYQNGSRTGFKRDRQGRIVESRLREDVLTRLAASGAYFRIGPTTSALSDVPAALRRLGSAPLEAEQFADYEEKFQWPLAAGLLLLLLGHLIPARTRATERSDVWALLGTGSRVR